MARGSAAVGGAAKRAVTDVSRGFADATKDPEVKPKYPKSYDDIGPLRAPKISREAGAVHAPGFPRLAKQEPQADDILADGKPRHWARMGKVPGEKPGPALNTEQKKRMRDALPKAWGGNPPVGGDPGTRVAGITDHLDKSLGLEEPSQSWSYQG